jgi:HSP20 family protein
MSPTNTQQRPAEIARWDPFEDLEHLQHQLAQVFPNWARLPAWAPAGTAGETEFAPLADVEETNDAFVVEIELAGVKKEDVNIEVSGHRLTVTGDRKERQREGTIRRRTRTVGLFRYEMILPVDVDDKKVEATLNDGVLTIRIPKNTAERPKRITIR